MILASLFDASWFDTTWRFGSTLLILAALSVFWFVVCSRITPFPGTKHEPLPEDAPDPPERYPALRRFTVTADLVLFVWIVLEGFFLIPFLFIKYGLH
jgi:hypothetical protein